MNRIILWSSTNCLTENRPVGRVVGRDHDYLVIDKFNGKFESLPLALLRETGMVEVVCDIPQNLPLSKWAETPEMWMLLTHADSLDELTTARLLRLCEVPSNEKKLICVWLLTAKHLNNFERSLRDSTLIPWLDGASSYPQPLSTKQTEALRKRRPDMRKYMIEVLSKPLSQWSIK